MAIVCTLLCLLVAIGCKKSESSPASPPSLQSEIIGKWNIDTAYYHSIQYGSTDLDTIHFTPGDYCDFKADSTLSILANGVAYNGNWWVDSSKLFITGTNYLDNPGGYSLPVLDQHNLQLYYSASAPNTFLETKLNLSK